jgi:prepilin-type N-terminal cleavage/methylation domain-containing protein
LRPFDVTDNRSHGGFTLIEMAIVVLVLTTLLAIAIPQVMRARENARTQGCIANLWQLQGAEIRWAMENRKAAGDIPTENELVPGHVKKWPQCPEGGTYTLQGSDKVPQCSVGGTHVIR